MSRGRPGSGSLSSPAAVCALACSWCWVIGMVFPAFMIHDFGWPGWIVFVVPNVIGAASVGMLLRSDAHARAFAHTHRTAVRLFTFATLSFHGFVLVWLTTRLTILPGPAWAWQLAAILVCALGVWWCARRRSLGAFGALAFIAVGGSALALALAWWTTRSVAPALAPALAPPRTTGEIPMPGALLALSGTALGFLTCPFLDATFLRIRGAIANPLESAGRFVAAFAGPFLLLVLMTAFYARGLLGGGLFSYWIALHIAVQSVFTCGFHAWARRTEAQGSAGSARASGSSWSPLAAFALGGLVAMAWLNLFGFRLGYELFLSLYALPFPAYVWIVCVWARRPTARAMAVWGVAVVAASPLFALGYLGGRWALVPLGVAVVVAAPVLLKGPRA